MAIRKNQKDQLASATGRNLRTDSPFVSEGSSKKTLTPWVGGEKAKRRRELHRHRRRWGKGRHRMFVDFMPEASEKWGVFVAVLEKKGKERRERDMLSWRTRKM